MELPKFAVDFLRECLKPDCKTGYLLVARKNSKSSSLAAFILAHIADGAPLRRAGFRCAVVSITKPKSGGTETAVSGHCGGQWASWLEVHEEPSTGEHRLPLGPL